MMALAMTMSDQPMAVNMGFQREYAERYDWLKQQFTDWIFIFSTSFLYYEDYDTNDEDTRNLFRQNIRNPTGAFQQLADQVVILPGIGVRIRGEPDGFALMP